MSQRYVKTDAGREEIRNRTRRLSRPARNLLLIMDEVHVGTSWVQLVHGATEDDLRALLAEGLIEPKNVVQEARQTRPSASLAEALARLSYDQVYTLITSQARDRLGLIRGYKLVLDVEKCSNIDELRMLAQRFMAMVQQHQGEAAARQMRMALGATA